jgi:hypothetical protein
MTAPSTDLSLSLDIERAYFQPEIVIEPADDFTPVMYFPYLPMALREELPQALVAETWAAYDADNPMEALPEDFGDGVEYINLGQTDDGVECLKQTPALKLARFGRQVIRVYGPSEYDDCEAYASTMFGWVCLSGGSDVGNDEKMIAYNSVIADCVEADKNTYQLPPLPETQDAGYYAGRGGRFDVKASDGKRDGRLHQLQDSNTGAGSQYYFRFKFGKQEYKRIYCVSGNRGKHTLTKQLRRIGRRTATFREVLNFNGDTEQTIRYWYDDPAVSVINWTRFLKQDGTFADVRPVNYSPGDKWWSDSWAQRTAARQGYEAKRGKTFYSKEPVWGSLVVQYQVSYTAFELFYDFPDPRRPYEVVVGGIERVGTLVKDYKNDDVVNNSALTDNDIGYDFQKKDNDWIRANKNKTDFDYAKAPHVYLKLFPKIRFKPYRVPSIELFYTNGKRVATRAWQPPQPEFMDLSQEELPKVAIFEERKRYRRYADDAVSNAEDYGEYERVIEAVFLDPLGNITRQRYEEGNDATEDNRPERT